MNDATAQVQLLRFTHGGEVVILALKCDRHHSQLSTR